jgi:hypothetical protein
LIQFQNGFHAPEGVSQGPAEIKVGHCNKEDKANQRAFLIAS